MSKRDRKGIPYEFWPLPKQIIKGAEWRSLPHSARALTIDLVAQYNGRNNGKLTPAWKALQEYGWASKETLANAKTALLEKTTFAVLTRRGHPPSTCDWIGFTWWGLDWDASMDIGQRAWPYLNFRTLQTALTTKAKHFGSPGNRTDDPPKTPPRPPETVPINGANGPPSVRKPGDATEESAQKCITPKIGDVLELPSPPPRTQGLLSPAAEPLQTSETGGICSLALAESARLTVSTHAAESIRPDPESPTGKLLAELEARNRRAQAAAGGQP